MNQELLQKLGNRIKGMSCNSLKGVYSSQIQEWLGSSNKETSDFIKYLLKERLLAEKYDFFCSCGNQNTAYRQRLERQPYCCPVCEKEYSLQEVQEEGSLLFEIDKESLMDYCEEAIGIELQLRINEKSVGLSTQEEKRMEIFIGSSSEARKDMLVIAAHLEDRGVHALPWDAADEDIFVAGTNTIDALFEITKRVDGAIFVFNADDNSWNDRSALEVKAVVRDNVLFEYGLFAGALGGKEKVCFICKGNPKIASDLKGITYIDGDKGTAKVRLGIDKWLERLKR